MSEQWEPRTVYMRHSSGKSSHIREHQCWHAGRFIAAEEGRCKAVNEKKSEGEPEVRVSIATREEYDAARFGARKSAREARTEL